RARLGQLPRRLGQRLPGPGIVPSRALGRRRRAADDEPGARTKRGPAAGAGAPAAVGAFPRCAWFLPSISVYRARGVKRTRATRPDRGSGASARSGLTLREVAMVSLPLVQPAPSAPSTLSGPRRRLPSWLKRPLPSGNENSFTHHLLRELRLETVCE